MILRELFLQKKHSDCGLKRGVVMKCTISVQITHYNRAIVN